VFQRWSALVPPRIPVCEVIWSQWTGDSAAAMRVRISIHKSTWLCFYATRTTAFQTLGKRGRRVQANQRRSLSKALGTGTMSVESQGDHELALAAEHPIRSDPRPIDETHRGGDREGSLLPQNGFWIFCGALTQCDRTNALGSGNLQCRCSFWCP